MSEIPEVTTSMLSDSKMLAMVIMQRTHLTVLKLPIHILTLFKSPV